MSRTIRRGKPSRNLKKYIKLHIICPENKTYRLGQWCPYNGLSYWKDDWDDQTTYKEYVEAAIRNYHKDKPVYGCPGWLKRIDVKNQSRKHRDAIRNAWKTGDWDIVLVKLDKAQEWMWY